MLKNEHSFELLVVYIDVFIDFWYGEEYQTYIALKLELWIES